MNKNLIERITNKYQQLYGKIEAVINAPGRINIIGEHTDYNEGFVLPAAIDKSTVSAIGKSKDDLCSIYALNVNETYEFSLKKIEPIKNGGWRNYIIGVVAEIQKKGLKVEPFNLVFGGDIPLGAGLSSSAALENSTVFGLNEVFKLSLNKHEMIRISQLSEHNYVGVKCGIMDQYASMFGVLESVLFLDCRTLDCESIRVDLGEYQIVLIDSNVKHNLVDEAYNERREVCERVSSMLNMEALRDASKSQLEKIKHKISNTDFDKALYVVEENDRVENAVECLLNKNIKGLGNLLFKSHSGLQKQYNVSCKELDFLVEQARVNDSVIGARMMGGGFGGCTINIVKKTGVQSFIDIVSDLYEQEFGASISMHNINLNEGVRLVNFK